MKKILSIVGVCALIFVLYTAHYYNRSIRYQAFKGMVTLKIVDYEGNIISNAHVNVGFANALNNNRYSCVGESDKNGCFTAKGVSDGDIVYTVTKKGYYKTYDKYWFSRGGTERSKWFPWILKFTPWNPTLDVVLKDIRNPIPMYVKNVMTCVPELNKPFGFDLYKGDWVAPYGKGETVDAFFTIINNKKSSIEYYKMLKITFPRKYDGLAIYEKDLFSKFQTIYEASNTNLILNSLVLETDRTKDKVIYEKHLPFEQYSVLLTRGEKKSNNNITNARYSKIFGKIKYGFGKGMNSLWFTYYYNPTPNDRNLEWNGSNLFDSVESE